MVAIFKLYSIDTEEKITFWKKFFDVFTETYDTSTLSDEHKEIKMALSIFDEKGLNLDDITNMSLTGG